MLGDQRHCNEQTYSTIIFYNPSLTADTLASMSGTPKNVAVLLSVNSTLLQVTTTWIQVSLRLQVYNIQALIVAIWL